MRLPVEVAPESESVPDHEPAPPEAVQEFATTLEALQLILVPVPYAIDQLSAEIETLGAAPSVTVTLFDTFPEGEPQVMV